MTDEPKPYLHFDSKDGKVGWGVPNPLDVNEVEWQLRYGDPVAVRMEAAAFVSAYKTLIGSVPQKTLLRQVSAIRKVVNGDVA